LFIIIYSVEKFFKRQKTNSNNVFYAKKGQKWEKSRYKRVAMVKMSSFEKKLLFFCLISIILSLDYTRFGVLEKLFRLLIHVSVHTVDE